MLLFLHLDGVVAQHVHTKHPAARPGGTHSAPRINSPPRLVAAAQPGPGVRCAKSPALHWVTGLLHALGPANRRAAQPLDANGWRTKQAPAHQSHKRWKRHTHDHTNETRWPCRALQPHNTHLRCRC